MADDGIKRVIIKQADLPAIKDSGEYVFRYRIKSKDNTQYSGWSKNYVVGLTNSIASLVAASPVRYQLTQIDNVSDKQRLQISWSMPDSIDLNYFDVYLKWYYLSTPPNEGTQLSTNWIQYPKAVYKSLVDIEIPPGAKYVQIGVTAETFPKFVGTIIDNEATFLFKTELRSIPITLDGGTIV
jgi:hypothetical protein